MGYQTHIRPTLVEPIPATRAQALRTMLSVSMLVDGVVDTDPGRFERHLGNCFLMPQAGLLLAGTLCRRPLVSREFAQVCAASQYDGILVRIIGDPSSPSVTFEIHQADIGATHWAYRLWMAMPSGPAWLVPSAGEGTFVRFHPLGLDFCDTAPFLCECERVRGLQHGNRYLSIATQGWF